MSGTDPNPVVEHCLAQLGSSATSTSVDNNNNLDLISCVVRTLQLGMDTFFLLYAVRECHVMTCLPCVIVLAGGPMYKTFILQSHVTMTHKQTMHTVVTVLYCSY
jgi:hypothetical protein